MKKTFLTISAFMMSMMGAYAQATIDTALDMQEGTNTTAAVAVDDYSKGAYFKYTATETVVVSATAGDGGSISLYIDGESTYDYQSASDENYNYTYSVKVNAGQTLTVLVRQGYSSTGTDAILNAVVYKNVFQHGLTENDPVNVETDGTFWFEGGNAYMTYTAAADGVLVLQQPSYCYGASYTVDGEKTELSYDSSTRQMSVPVVAGKTYSIYSSVSSYSNAPFSITTKFTQPKQGETVDNPFVLAMGENVLPAAAGKYYYRFINGDDAGFLTVSAANCNIGARGEGYSYDNLGSTTTGQLKVQLDMEQEAFIVVEKYTATDTDEVLTASFELPAAGDIEGNPIVIASSETEKVAAPAGAKFYSLKNEGENPLFLNVSVETEGVSSYSSSQVKVYVKGESYQWSGYAVSSGETYKVQVPAGATYMIRVNNMEENPLEFRAWFSEIAEGDLYSMPIAAVSGENTVAVEGQKFYAYTAESDCRLTVTLENKEATLFFPSYDGDEYSGLDLISSENGVYVLAATAGTKYIFRMTGGKAGDKFSIEEGAYAPGQSRATAIEISDKYVFDDLTTSVWLVYTADKSGVAEITPEGFLDVSYLDALNFDVNGGNQTNLCGYDASQGYIYTMFTKSAAVNAGDKIYFEVKLNGIQEGATLSINIREPLPGEAPATAVAVNVNEPTTLPAVAFGSNFWYTFTVESACDVTFSASEYASINLYDSEMEQIHCGEYSPSMTLGSYYEPYTMSLTPGTYYLEVTYTDGSELTVAGEGVSTGIAEMNGAASMLDGASYNLAGQRVGNAARGIIIKNGKKFMVK